MQDDRPLAEALDLATGRDLDEPTQVDLAGHSVPIVRRNLAVRNDLVAGAVDVLAVDEDGVTRELLVEAQDLDQVTEARLASDDRWHVRRAVARCARAAVAERLSADPDPLVRCAVVVRSDLSVGSRQQLASDPDAVVRAGMASRPDLSATEIDRLIADPDVAVRCRLAKNPSLSMEVIGRLATDHDRDVRRRVANRLDDIGVNARASLAETDPDLLVGRTERLEQAQYDALADNGDDWIRAGVAAHPELPVEVVDRLLSDPSARVRRALARRADLSIDAVRSLAADSDRTVRGTLRGQGRDLPPDVVALLNPNRSDPPAG